MDNVCTLPAVLFGLKLHALVKSYKSSQNLKIDENYKSDLE